MIEQKRKVILSTAKDHTYSEYRILHCVLSDLVQND
jgi:hypothetical protein